MFHFLLACMFLSSECNNLLVSHAGGTIYNDDSMTYSLMTMYMCHAGDITYADHRVTDSKGLPDQEDWMPFAQQA